MSWTWTIAIALAALGLYLFRRGLKGKLLDNHPLCRRCHFDLFNKPPDSTRCPECGSDLTHPRPTLPGHRQRRPILITLGLLFLIPPLALAIFFATGTQINWIKYEPAWLLTSQSQSPDPSLSNAALNELLLRARSAGLSPIQLSALADVALPMPNPVDPRWDALLELAHSANALTPLQQQAYTKRILQRVTDFEKSITVNSARLMGDQWMLDLGHSSPPLPLAFDVTVRNDKDQWTGGTLMCFPRTHRSHTFIHPHNLQSRQPILLDEPKIDIVLHPNPNLASLPPGFSSILSQDITFRNIPVDDPFGESRRRELRFQRQLREDHGKEIAVIKDVKGVILRVQSHNAAAGLASGIADGLFRLAFAPNSSLSPSAPFVPAQDRLDLLIFPGLPFQSRFKVDGGFITVQGELHLARDPSSFTLHCRLIEDYSNAHEHSRLSLENTFPIQLDESSTLGISNTTSWNLTLLDPDDATPPTPTISPRNRTTTRTTKSVH